MEVVSLDSVLLTEGSSVVCIPVMTSGSNCVNNRREGPTVYLNVCS